MKDIQGELEKWINCDVEIESSSVEGLYSRKGELTEVDFPFGVKVYTGETKFVTHTAVVHCYSTFAGYDSGIVRITSNGKVIYEQPKIPIPYPYIEAFDEARLDNFKKDVLNL